MKAIKRLGLRWLLPLVMTALSALAFWCGAVQDEVRRAALEKQGWHFGAAWHPNSLVEVVSSINLPAMLGGVLLLNLVPETWTYAIVFGLFVPAVWWLVGRSADVEFRLGSARSKVNPPLRERTITLSCGISAILLLAMRIIRHTFSARFLGLFWVVLLPVSIMTAVSKWRRRSSQPH